MHCVTAIGLLRDREPGAFVIRDSHSFRGAYGLAMKVASPPPSVHQSKKGKGQDGWLHDYFKAVTNATGIYSGYSGVLCIISFSLFWSWVRVVTDLPRIPKI